MSKVTSKRQVTLPKAIADQYGIHPGDELEWTPAGESIRIELARPGRQTVLALSLEEKLALFDQNMARLKNPQAPELKEQARLQRGQKERGWKREDLYDRGFPRRH
ncbi:MAG TPA: AbrB/MazE/SpoVT family DNA-binding domain-containing protein [Terriglobales bacterium]|nr:AbrB/MazE/SpoVT family DNA-binding domain-containing protein [Terriglobales bacterium]